MRNVDQTKECSQSEHFRNNTLITKRHYLVRVVVRVRMRVVIVIDASVAVWD